MTNGGTGPFFGQLVFVNEGRGSIPPSLVLVDPANPSNTTVLLDNFFGRQFNSLNDIKIHPKTGKLFFTDSTYVPATFDCVPVEPRRSDQGFQVWLLEQLPPTPVAAKPSLPFRPQHGFRAGGGRRLHSQQRHRILSRWEHRLRVRTSRT